MTGTRNGNDVLEHRIGADGELSLRVHTGEVTVRGTDDEVVRVRDLDGGDLGQRFHIERADGRLVVRPRERVILDLGIGRRGRQSARLEVDVPRSAAVSLDTASGGLRATGLVGEQRYRTASGSVEVRDALGTIGVDAVSGAVDIEARGPVELSGRLVSGDLELRGGTLRTVAVATTSGDVELDAPLAGPGPYSIQTVSGDARIRADDIEIDARTVTGDIAGNRVRRSESGPGRRRLVIGAGGPIVSFQSISGDLAVSHSAPGAAVSQAAPEPPLPPEPPAPPVAGLRTGTPPVDGPEWAASRPDPEDARLAVLREVEAGTIDVATATARLAELEDADDV